jgi:hypothetical protein
VVTAQRASQRALAAIVAGASLAGLALPIGDRPPVHATSAEEPQAARGVGADPADTVYTPPSDGADGAGLRFTPATEPSRCDDDTGTWMGTRWRSPLRWRFNRVSTPSYLGDRAAVVATVRLAAATLASGANVCGIPGRLRATQSYEGPTGRTAAVTHSGGCGERDGVNTVSFGALDPGLLALTCVWWHPARGREGTTVEADILIRDSPDTFFLTTPVGCSQEWDLRSALTHEFGHAFGLGHVDAGSHGGQTMSNALPACTTDRRQLGRGDYDTLREHYGTG